MAAGPSATVIGPYGYKAADKLSEIGGKKDVYCKPDLCKTASRSGKAS